MTKKVSVVIPVYNGSNYLKVAVDSVLAQTYKNIEIIVVNDGSCDNGATREVALSYGDKIKYYEKENGGVSTAMNFAIEKMTGEYFAWLSHDDIYYPDKIEKEIEVINKLEDKNTIIFSNFELIDSNGKVFSKTNYTENISKDKLCQGIYPVINACVNGCTILVNKKCFDKVGLFDESLRTTNDYDMWLRLFSNFPSYLIEDYLVQYRIHDFQDTKRSPVYVSESNTLWKKIITGLDYNEIKSWGVDSFNLYYDFYRRMEISGYMEASKAAYDIAKKYYGKNNPVLSVIMPCYNAEDYIGDAISSILDQSYCSFELIIVDDSSTDKSLSIAKDYAKKDFRVKVIKNKNKKGVSGAVNTGYDSAKGRFVTRQDADDISLPSRLLKQVNCMESDDRIGYCSVNLNTINQEGTIISEKTYISPVGPIEFEAGITNPIPNAPIVYRMDLLNKYKLRLNDFKIGEDYDLLVRYIYNTKTKGVFIDEGLYSYRIMDSSLYHANFDESIQVALDIAFGYYSKIDKSTTAKEDFDYLNLISNNGEGRDKNTEIEKYFRFAKACSKYYDWSDEEQLMVIKKMANLRYSEPVSSNEFGFVKAIKHQINENGIGGTIKWMICWPFKKIFK